MKDAIGTLRSGGLVAYPTETVWGLGANSRSEAALARLRAWKGRDTDRSISILVGGSDEIEALGLGFSPAARALTGAFWPGPLTLILPGGAAADFAAGIANPNGGVGVRCSPHPVARALARAAAAGGAGPITATSLNKSGEPAARNRSEARAIAAGGPEPIRIVEGEDAGGEAPTTVLDLTNGEPRLLRAGPVSEAAIRATLGEAA